MLYRFAPALAALCCGAALLQPAAADPLQVCAVPPLYPALTAWTAATKPQDLALHFDSAAGLYARLINEGRGCDVLLSGDERLPILLIRARRADAASLRPFARVPLTLYSADPKLLQNHTASPAAFYKAVEQLNSLALPRAELTPAGFAATQVTEAKAFPRRRLNNKIYPADHEYQAYAMISSGNVQAGFITLPLALQEPGSYMEVPSALYPEICYYAVILNTAEQARAQAFTSALGSDEQLRQCLQQAGFTPLPPSAGNWYAAEAQQWQDAGGASAAPAEEALPAVPAADPHEFDDLDDDLFDYLN